MKPTLKARITLWNVLVIASALSLFGSLLYVWLSHTLYRHHDADLAEEARRVVRTLSSSTEPLEALDALDRTGAAAPLLMLRDADGNMLFRSERLARAEPNIGEHEVLIHAAASGVTADQYFTVHLGRGPVRFACVPLAHPNGTYLQLGRSLGDVDTLLGVVALASVVLIPVVIVLASVGGFLIANRALRPIDDIATSLESIQATDLSRRVDPHAPDVEVTRLTASINRLLDRLQTSFSVLKEFTADVSHQLQTPLTVMRGAIDSARDGTPDQQGRVIAELSHDVSALTATLQDVRDFALAEVDSAGSRSGPVDVSQVFDEAAELIRALAEAHHVGCRVTVARGLMVWGNAIRLRQVVLNIGENAVQATPPGGLIQVEVTRHRSRVVATISDTGRGIPAELLPRVFERHVHARPPGAPAGSGVGLAIVKRIVEAHGGTVELSSVVGRGTTAIVTLPLANLDGDG